MARQASDGPPPLLHPRPVLFLSFAVVFAIRLLHWLGGKPGLLTGSEPLFGPDSYMRLVKVAHWLETGGWYAGTFPLMNPPQGLELHWTKPMDLVLAAGALPLSLFMDLDRALLLWGGLASPLLAGLGAVALSLMIRPIMGSGWFVFSAFVLALQPIATSYTFVGRPDHHGLLFFLFLHFFALCVRAAMEPDRRRLPFLAGLVAGVGLWVSVEAVVGIAVGLAVPGLFWLHRGARPKLRIPVVALLAATATLTAALAVERPPSAWPAVEYDRLSLVHWVMVASATSALALVWTAPSGLSARLTGRLALAVFAVAVPTLVMVLGFPRFFQGPYVDLDPAIVDIWFVRVAEVQPLLPADLKGLAEMLLILGPAFPAVAHALWILRRPASHAHAVFAVATLVSMAVFVPLSLHQTRWAMYFGAVAAPPLVFLLQSVMAAGIRLRLPGDASLPLRAPLFLLLFLWHPIAWGVLTAATKPDTAADPKPTAACDWQTAGSVLESLAKEKGRPLVLMTENDFGPIVLYHSGQPVIGGPYHRNTAGISDSYHFFATRDTAEMAAIAARRRPDYAVFCAALPGDDGAGDDGTMRQRLAAGWRPAWLRDHPSASLADDIRLLAVVVDRLP